jgi:protein FrlC
MSPTPRPLAYSTNGFTTRPLAEALEVIAACGYAGVELLGDRPHWAPRGAAARHAHVSALSPVDRRLRPLSAAEVRRALSDAGLWVSSVNGNTAMLCWPEELPEVCFEPALSSPHAAVRQRRLEVVFELLEWAAEVGAPRVSVTSGRCPGGCPPGEGLAYLAESLSVLCERAVSLGLQLSVEYEPGLLVERSDELAALIARVGHAALGANLDLGHARCAGEDPHVAIRRLAGRIWSVHLEDILGVKHYHLVPGEGDMDLRGYVGSLDAVGFAGPLTVELYTCAGEGDALAARRAIEGLRRVGI